MTKDCCLMPQVKTWRKIFKRCDFCEAVWAATDNPYEDPTLYLRAPWSDEPTDAAIVDDYKKTEEIAEITELLEPVSKPKRKSRAKPKEWITEAAERVEQEQVTEPAE